MRRTRINNVKRERRKKSVRKNLFGTAERPRLSVHRSLQHIYAQIINDETGETIAAASTQTAGIKEAVAEKGGNKAAAEKVGAKLAELTLEKGIKKVCFDRGPYKYHGRVRALADAARKAGLEF